MSYRGTISNTRFRYATSSVDDIILMAKMTMKLRMLILVKVYGEEFALASLPT